MWRLACFGVKGKMVTIARLARGEPDVVVACHCDPSNWENSEQFQPHRTHFDRAARYHRADLNKNHTKADWHFTTANARIKLRRLYPAS